MTKRDNIRQVLEGLGYAIPDADVYKHIGLWRDWYRGYHKTFHDYTVFNGRRKVQRRRQSLRMAKRVCEDHANLLLNEKVQITAKGDAAQKAIDAALQANHFRVQANKLVEWAFALGTAAFVEIDNADGTVTIDYVRGDMIFPIAWDGDEITSCVFASIKTLGGKQRLYIQIHEKGDTGYTIKNRIVELDANGSAVFGNQPAAEPGKKPRKLPVQVKPDPETGILPGDIASEFETGSLTPRFQIIRPNQVNNVDLDSPLGVSVFANSLDILEGIDLVYDSYCNEFRLGKKRIIIPLTMLQLTQDDDETWMAFDDNDTEFYGLKDDNQKDIKEINMSLRVVEHDQALQRFLNMLSAKAGLGNDRYIFEGGQAKTATEVISEKSELYQNLKKNELVLEAALKDLCKAILEITGSGAAEVEVRFDDSIIEDSHAKRNRMQVLATQGLFPLWRYFSEYEGYSEEDAKAIAAEVEAAQPEEPPIEEGPTDGQV